MLNSYPKIRTGLYLVATLAAVVAPVVAVTHPEYGTAITTASGVLMAAAGVTAASNIKDPAHISDEDEDVDALVAEMHAEGEQEIPVPEEITDDELAGLEVEPDEEELAALTGETPERAAELGLGKHGRIE